MTSQSRLFHILPESVREIARDLAPIGVAELAFPLNVASVALAAIEREGWRVLGGDLYVEQQNLPARPTGENWFCQREEDPQIAFGRARAFIDRWIGRDDQVYLVTFVLD